jgi:hypothetical protein
MQSFQEKPGLISWSPQMPPKIRGVENYLGTVKNVVMRLIKETEVMYDVQICFNNLNILI